MNNLSLFISAAVIWGSTWLMITFQLGEVAPLVSVIYRFLIASLILFIFCLITQRKFNFSYLDHLFILLQGLLLFGFNYWLTYLAITKINSALAAILSTSIVYFNVIFARFFLKDKIRTEVIAGASIGIIGVILIFLPELKFTDNQTETWDGIWLLIFGSIFASLGNIVSAKTQRRKIPVVQANALGMSYAAILLAIIATIDGASFNFEFTFSYIASLFYLALFGSVLAFGAFLTLIGKIGPDKAGYVTLVYPVIAMFLSTFFEHFNWTTETGIGLIAILAGNYIAMGKYRNTGIYKSWKKRRQATPENGP